MKTGSGVTSISDQLGILSFPIQGAPPDQELTPVIEHALSVFEAYCKEHLPPTWDDVTFFASAALGALDRSHCDGLVRWASGHRETGRNPLPMPSTLSALRFEVALDFMRIAIEVASEGPLGDDDRPIGQRDKNGCEGVRLAYELWFQIRLRQHQLAAVK